MFFDPRRYDLAKVGRYKFNKKLNFRNRIWGHKLAEDVVDVTTGEIIASAGDTLTKDSALAIQNAAVPYVWLAVEDRKVKVLSNMMVDITKHVDITEEEAKSLGIHEAVYYPVLKTILEENTSLDDIKEAIKKNASDLVPKHITVDDIIASINYNIHLEYGVGTKDDIDHLGNRRIRAVGELLQNQYRIGLSRMERVVRERMTTQDVEGASPQTLINIKPVTAAVKEFLEVRSCHSLWIRITLLVKLHIRDVFQHSDLADFQEIVPDLRFEMFIIHIMAECVLLRHLKDLTLVLSTHLLHTQELMSTDL